MTSEVKLAEHGRVVQADFKFLSVPLPLILPSTITNITIIFNIAIWTSHQKYVNVRCREMRPGQMLVPGVHAE